MNSELQYTEKGWNRTLIHSMHRRCTNHDYADRSIYMVTIITKERQPVIGQVVATAAKHSGTQNDYTIKKEQSCVGACLLPSEIGETISAVIESIPQFHPQVEVVAYQLMPDHVHILLYVHERLPKVNGRQQTLSSLIRGIKSACPHIFDKGFHDRILYHKNQLSYLTNYIKDNPRRYWLRCNNPSLFTLKRNFHYNEELTFSTLGNIFLLDYPIKQIVEVSRSVSQDRLNQLKSNILDNAVQGAITITAAISEGEKQIARIIREAGFPLVVILKDGFPKEGDEQEKYYKPGGIYFDACSKGKLLLLEPTEASFSNASVVSNTEATLKQKAEAKHQDYAPIPQSSKRWRFIAVNEMARMLVFHFISCPWVV